MAAESATCSRDGCSAPVPTVLPEVRFCLDHLCPMCCGEKRSISQRCKDCIPTQPLELPTEPAPPPRDFSVCARSKCGIFPRRGTRYCSSHMCPVCSGEKRSTAGMCAACWQKSKPTQECATVGCVRKECKGVALENMNCCADHLCPRCQGPKMPSRPVCWECFGLMEVGVEIEQVN